MANSKNDSPIRGIRKVLTKARSGKDELQGPDNGSSPRGSIETFPEASGDSKISKLFSRRRSKKGRTSQATGSESRQGGDVEGGTSGKYSNSESRSTLDNDDVSSMLTSDSEDET